jgi:chromosome segregation ATPase
MDVAALRAFQDVWGPVISAIPAVINMAESFADVERGLAAKQKELADVMAKVDSSMDAGNAKYAALQDEIAKAAVTLADLNAQINAKQVEAKDAAAAAKAAASAEVSKVRAEVAAEIKGIRAKVKADTADLEAVKAEKQAVVAAAQEQLVEIEKRTATAEKALAALRAKLG